MIKKILLLSLLLLSYKANACNTLFSQTPNFTINNLGSIKNNVNNQTINTIVLPSRYDTIINNCLYSGNNFFQINSSSSLSLSDGIFLNGRQYYRILSTPTPLALSSAQIYIAFSVRDNQDSAELFPINTTNQYTLFSGISSTRGMRLEQVSILIKGTNLIPGNYNLNNIILGTFTATGKAILGIIPTSESKNITLSNLSYTISTSTCVVNNSNITLPTIRSSDFTSTNKIKGTTDFVIMANCPNDIVNTKYSATITDNFNVASNSDGLLSNSISETSGGSNVQIRLTHSSNEPIKIGPLSLDNKFDFGTLNNSKTVSKSLKASYYSSTLPATPGIVRGVGVINLIYD